eukprot:968471-Prymnesium_polylepis.1
MRRRDRTKPKAAMGSETTFHAAKGGRVRRGTDDSAQEGGETQTEWDGGKAKRTINRGMWTE